MTGIGGSEIAAVAGLSPYAGPLDVYLKKKGLAQDSSGFAAERGQFLEPALLAWYSARTSRTIEYPGTLRHPKYDRVLATPDGLAIDTVLEVKSPGRYTAQHWGEPGTDEIPDYYIPQVQFELAVTGTRKAHVITCIHDDLAIYEVGFDVELFEALAEIAQRFWVEHIEADVPPPPNGSERARQWLVEKYPRATLPTVEANSEIVTLAREYIAAREAEKAADERKAECANKLRALLGDSAGAQGGGVSISYKNNKDGTKTDWEAIAKFVNVPDDIIASHTRTVPGARVLRVTEKG